MKKIPVSWIKEKGIELAIGDKWSTKDETLQGTIGNDDVIKSFLASVFVNEPFITSFADRQNPGKQPVADWVPVDYTCPSGSRGFGKLNLDWSLTDDIGDIKHWRPNFDALHDIYTKEKEAAMWNKLEQMTETADHYSKENQCFYRVPKAGSMAEVLVDDARWQVSDCTTIKDLDDDTFFKLERDAEEINFSGNEHEQRCGKEHLLNVSDPDLYMRNDASEFFVIGERDNFSDKLFDKPVFTQAMADAGIIPPIGFECEWGGHDSNFRNCIVRGVYNSDVWMQIEGNLRTVGNPTNFRLIDTRTDEKKLRDEMYLVVSNDCDPEDIDLLLFSDKFTITLNEVK